MRFSRTSPAANISKNSFGNRRKWKRSGGIAHDFNNMLTAISGYSDLILADENCNDNLREQVVEIKKASDRSVALTQPLLAFSRRQLLQPKFVDLNQIVQDMSRTDVVMPRMSGRTLAEKLVETNPSLPVLYMSGYTDDTVMRRGGVESDISFVKKPFAPAPLLQRVNKLLNKTAL